MPRVLSYRREHLLESTCASRPIPVGMLRRQPAYVPPYVFKHERPALVRRVHVHVQSRARAHTCSAAHTRSGVRECLNIVRSMLHDRARNLLPV